MRIFIKYSCGFILHVLCVLLLCGGIASAATIIVTDVDPTRGESIWINEDGQNVDAYFAGVLLISLTSNGQTVNRDTLCVDLFTDIYIRQMYGTSVLHPYQVPGEDLARVSWLVDNALLPTQSSYPSLLPEEYWVNTPAEGAGIQLAIWDIVHDGGDGLYAGRVQAATGPNGQVTDPLAVAAAQYYLSSSVGMSSGLAYIYSNVNLSNNLPAQMLAGPMFTDGGPVPNPEPSTLILVGAALVAVGCISRRKKTGVTPAAK